MPRRPPVAHFHIGQHHGLMALTLENARLRVMALPEAGANIRSIIYKPVGREMLWHNPVVMPAAHEPGTVFDDVFAGGWDDMFPNGCEESFGGRAYQDHGELWTLRWDWEYLTIGAQPSIHLWCQPPRTPARVDKWLSLPPTAARLTVRYRITHLGDKAFPYSFTLHPALPAPRHGRLDLGADTMQIDPWGWGDGPSAPSYHWPAAPRPDGTSWDMRRITPALAGAAGLHYVTCWRDNRCRLSDHDVGLALSLTFPTEFFRAGALFFTYGGWRDIHTLIPEPSTSWPASLEAAQLVGRAAQLEPGQPAEFWVEVAAHNHSVRPLAGNGYPSTALHPER